jgi:hypothetical protein
MCQMFKLAWLPVAAALCAFCTHSAWATSIAVQSLPGAVSLPGTYVRDPPDDHARQSLKSWLDRQLNGQMSRRLITFSWNAEQWHARNLALELIALGYPNVSWYRGGVEAWDVAGYPVVEKR